LFFRNRFVQQDQYGCLWLCLNLYRLKSVLPKGLPDPCEFLFAKYITNAILSLKINNCNIDKGKKV